MSTYFQIYRDHANQWRWRLRTANHKIIADSAEGYWNKDDCIHGINPVKQSWNAPVYEAWSVPSSLSYLGRLALAGRPIYTAQ